MTADMLYVSWGGSGRPASLRMAMERAFDADVGLIYLAVLDATTFDDLDDTMFDLVDDELRWLLDAQLELARRQTGYTDLEMRVVIRRGNIDDEVRAVVEATGVEQVFVGAPIVAPNDNLGEALLTSLRSAVDASIEVLQPA